MHSGSSSGRPLSRRSVLAAGGAALVAGSGGLASTPAAARPQGEDAASSGYDLIWNEWGPLTGYGVDAECNPGQTTSYACGTDDVGITHLSDHSEVTANPRSILTFVNAIGRIKLQDTTPDGQPISLTSYQYVYAVCLPVVPQSAPLLGEQIHQMIQFWDGSNRLWQADMHTLEAAIYWKINPYDPTYGKVFAYTMQNGALAAVDTGIAIEPDTNWHVFDVRADLANRTYAGITVNGVWNDLAGLPLAQVYHPDWGSDLSLILTAESENAYPGSNNTVTQWTTRFKDPKLYRFD